MQIWIPQAFVILPSIVVSLVGLVLTGLIEKHYVGRLAIIANIFFLWQVLLPKNPTETAIIFYLNASIFFLVMALYSFLSGLIPILKGQSLSTLFYKLSNTFYSSKTVLGIMIAVLLGGGFVLAILISAIIWVIAVVILKHSPPFMQQNS